MKKTYIVAKFTMLNSQKFDELMSRFSSIEANTDAVCEKALTAAGEIVEAKVRENLESIIGKNLKVNGRSTGELIESLGTSPMLIDANGNYSVKVGFNEPRREKASNGASYNEVTNAMIASVIEYGKVGQPPKPFMKPALSSVKNKAKNKMKEVLEEEFNKS